ncbi:hypothetical protein GCM10020367_40820 [Streptomyces sannanensis]|uniref:Uncharacterized protein n=1 Tax=Streptomyces sannanensis TaxID=285536 RepID=A0ABP6SFZ0_9ACTN
MPGHATISRTLTRGQAGPYQPQAAIAAVHDEAEHTDATDRPQILAPYDSSNSSGRTRW